EILHADRFRQLEATWRGLQFLVNEVETGPALRIRVLNVSKTELLRDLVKATNVDQSAIFRKIYEEEYGTFGGRPGGLIVGDFEFGPDENDMQLLDGMAAVAAIAYAPFVASASPALFGLSSF